jgi:hypothetical protein
MPRKRQPHGRPIGVSFLDLFAGDAKAALQRVNAPLAWADNENIVSLLIDVAFAGFPDPMHPAGRVRLQAEADVAGLSSLSREDRRGLFAALAEIARVMDDVRSTSPEFIAAFVLARRPDLLDQSNEDIAAVVSRALGVTVSAKTVEHAVSRITKAKLARPVEECGPVHVTFQGRPAAGKSKPRKRSKLRG